VTAFSLPTRKQRIVIMGHTGCGKTQFGVWVLSCAELERMPWVVIDYKNEELINAIPYRHEIGFNDTPKQPGVHILHALPSQNEHVEKFLWRIWERGNTGVFVDEAYNMPDAGAYQALLTQGRSKNIPMINLTQQPTWIPRHVFSESDYYSAFHLTDRRDRKRINEFMPVDLETPIPDYHSHYYRVKDRAKFGLKPSPDADTLLEKFSARLRPKRRML
jgi:hypothetical protein